MAELERRAHTPPRPPPSLTDSGWRISEDAETRVPADPRGGQVPGGELGPYSGLPAGNLLPPVAVPSLPPLNVTGGAPAPVALLLLPIHTPWFGRAGTPRCGRGGGAGGGAPRRLGVGVGADAVEVDQPALLLLAQLEPPQGLLGTGIRIRSGALRWRLLFWGGGVVEEHGARFSHGGRGRWAGRGLPGRARLRGGRRLLGLFAIRFRRTCWSV